MENGKIKVVVGLSGGVDSSVAAYLLKEQGYDVVGLFMRNWHDTTGTLEGDCPWYDDQVFAELVAKRLDIPFHFVDLSEQYRARVVDYMFAEYGRGRTPNPDVLCNREIKFDAFLEEALKLGADYVATGHYCRRRDETVGGEVYHRLLAGADPNKDQSYFLCQLSQQQLSRAMFPIGDMLKPQVRRIAAEQKLATAKRKDSQGICFVGKVDLPVFLQQQLAPQRGDSGRLGRLCGGRRPDRDRGDGAAVPLYARRRGEGGRTQRCALLYRRPAQRSGGERPGRTALHHCDRYGHQYRVCGAGTGASRALPACLADTSRRGPLGEPRPAARRRGAGSLLVQDTLSAAVAERSAYVVFDTPQRGITPGQFAAWYAGEELVGSGVIAG